jgi:hypothetical protein
VCPHYAAQGVSIRSCALPTNYRATRALNCSAEALMRANSFREPYPQAAPNAGEGTPALLIACSWETEIAEICAWIYLVLSNAADRDRHSAPQLPKLAPELEDTLRLRFDSLAGAITPEELIYLVATNAIGNWLKGASTAGGWRSLFSLPRRTLTREHLQASLSPGWQFRVRKSSCARSFHPWRTSFGASFPLLGALLLSSERWSTRAV